MSLKGRWTENEQPFSWFHEQESYLFIHLSICLFFSALILTSHKCICYFTSATLTEDTLHTFPLSQIPLTLAAQDISAFQTTSCGSDLEYSFFSKSWILAYTRNRICKYIVLYCTYCWWSLSLLTRSWTIRKLIKRVTKHQFKSAVIQGSDLYLKPLNLTEILLLYPTALI